MTAPQRWPLLHPHQQMHPKNANNLRMYAPDQTSAILSPSLTISKRPRFSVSALHAQSDLPNADLSRGACNEELSWSATLCVAIPTCPCAPACGTEVGGIESTRGSRLSRSASHVPTVPRPGLLGLKSWKFLKIFYHIKSLHVCIEH
jgi:hypothetical protein